MLRVEHVFIQAAHDQFAPPIVLPVICFSRTSSFSSPLCSTRDARSSAHPSTVGRCLSHRTSSSVEFCVVDASASCVGLNFQVSKSHLDTRRTSPDVVQGLLERQVIGRSVLVLQIHALMDCVVSISQLYLEKRNSRFVVFFRRQCLERYLQRKTVPGVSAIIYTTDLHLLQVRPTATHLDPPGKIERALIPLDEDIEVLLHLLREELARARITLQSTRDDIHVLDACLIEDVVERRLGERAVLACTKGPAGRHTLCRALRVLRDRLDEIPFGPSTFLDTLKMSEW